MKLYQLTKELNELQAMLDTGEMTEEMLADTLEGVSLEFDDKVKGCCQIIRMEEGYSNAIDDEIERLRKMHIHHDNNVNWLKSYIAFNMQSLSKDKINTGLFKLTLRKPTIKLGDLEMAKIPNDYFEEVPATVKLDKRSLLSAAKLGDVPGVTLEESNRSLTIK